MYTYANFQLSDVMVKDICEGVEGSGVRCGVIGEVGISWPMTDFEKWLSSTQVRL